MFVRTNSPKRSQRDAPRTLEFSLDGFMNELITVDLASQYIEVVGFSKLPRVWLTIRDEMSAPI
jgi:hypothetical protein